MRIALAALHECASARALRHALILPYLQELEMDVFSYLPPELVAEILLLLPSEDLVNCLQVSSTWRQLVSSFRSLWTRRCLDYGMPDYYLHEESVNPVDLLFATRRQRRYISSSKHTVYPDIRNVRSCEFEGSVDEDAARTCSVHPRQVLHAGSGILVVVMFGQRKGAKEKEQASATATNDGESSRSSAYVSFTPYNELKQRYHFEFILVERLNASSGRTEEVCRVVLEDKWKWPVITQAFTAKDQSWVVLRVKETWIETAWYKIELPSNGITGQSQSNSDLQLPDFSSLHHPSNPYDVSCCCKCSTVALVKNKLSMRPPWECSIDMLYISRAPVDQQVKQHTIPILNYDQLRLASDVHANVVFRPTFFCQQSSECTSHKLVLWRTNDHMITVHNFSEKEGVSEEPVATFIPVPQGKTLDLSTAWGHARMKFSADFQLLGFLMARYLHLWSLVTYEKLRTIYLQSIPGLRSWMLALGHVYCLFGTLHDRGEMVLVSTQTDQVVWRCESFLQPGSEAARLRHVQLNGVVHEDWMNDVHKLCPANAPFLLYTCLHQLDPIAMSGLAFV